MILPTHRVCAKRGQPFIKTAILLMTAVLFGVVENIYAGDVVYDQAIQFNIPAQSLSSALTRFSADTRLQVLYEVDMADNLKAPALNGTYTQSQALKKLLSNFRAKLSLQQWQNHHTGEIPQRCNHRK